MNNFITILIKNMWKNPNEVPNNGKDDDGNGYIDDIYGWNFIGGKNGDIDVDNMEVTRVVKKYQSLFEGPNSATNKANQAKIRKVMGFSGPRMIFYHPIMVIRHLLS